MKILILKVCLHFFSPPLRSLSFPSSLLPISLPLPLSLTSSRIDCQISCFETILSASHFPILFRQEACAEFLFLERNVCVSWIMLLSSNTILIYKILNLKTTR